MQSLNFSNKYKVDSLSLANVLLMLILLFGVVRGGFDKYNYGITTLVLIGMIGYCIILKTIRINISSILLWPFLIAIILEIPLQMISNGGYYNVKNAINGVVVFALMYMVVLVLCNHGSSKMIWNLVNMISIAASSLILLQVLCHYILHINLDGLPIIGEYLFNSWTFKFYRPCGMFSEPSLYAELVLFSLYYYSFISINKKWMILHTLALLLSTSSLAIVGAVFIYAMLFMNMNRMKSMSKEKRLVFSILLFCSAIVLLIWISNTSNPVVVRVLSGGTSEVRITRSYELFMRLPIMNKIWGIGIQNQELYLNYYNIILNSDKLGIAYTNREFAATIGYILCTTGVLGLTVFLAPLVKIFKRYDYRMKVLLMLFGIVCFTCCVFSRMAFCVFLVLIFATKEIICKEVMNE